jgi:hypothetical protein
LRQEGIDGRQLAGKRQAKENLMAQRYEQRSKQYLQELRRGAMLEYK